MSYKLFDICSVQVAGQSKRGARTICGHCKETAVTAVNTLKDGAADDDDERLEKIITGKFEKLGWKIGKQRSKHRCPKCFTAIKISAVRKSNMKHDLLSTTKLSLPVTPKGNGTEPLPRTMTRDERRIIFEKINEVYVGEKVGYSDSWDDEKVSKDLGVPRAWVSNIREDMFGPDVNEATQKQLEELKGFSEELAAILITVQALSAKIQQFERALSNPSR